jgi:hypothetical protein
MLLPQCYRPSTNLIAENEIKLLLNYCQKSICKEFLYDSAYILKKYFKDFCFFILSNLAFKKYQNNKSK